MRQYLDYVSRGKKTSNPLNCEDPTLHVDRKGETELSICAHPSCPLLLDTRKGPMKLLQPWLPAVRSCAMGTGVTVSPSFLRWLLVILPQQWEPGPIDPNHMDFSSHPLVLHNSECEPAVYFDRLRLPQTYFSTGKTAAFVRRLILKVQRIGVGKGAKGCGMNRKIVRSKQWPLVALTSRGMHSDVPFASPGASPLRDIIEFRKTHTG